MNANTNAPQLPYSLRPPVDGTREQYLTPYIEKSTQPLYNMMNEPQGGSDDAYSQWNFSAEQPIENENRYFLDLFVRYIQRQHALNTSQHISFTRFPWGRCISRLQPRSSFPLLHFLPY